MGKNTLLFASMMLLAACTQEPADVVYKGGNHYAHNNVEYAKSSDNSPALVIAKRQSPERIFVTDNLSVEPVKNEQEFRRVVDAIKQESAKAKTPITVVAIPVEKPAIEPKEEVQEVAEYGERGLLAVKPTDKPNPPQWYAQRDNKANVVAGFIWPLRGKIISTFGGKQNGLVNDGINIAAPEGKAIKAAADGEVVYAGNELEGYGNMLIIRHNNGWASAYAHTQKIRVGLGAKVSQGQVIAEVGRTGDVTKAQLHFGLRKDKQAVNPMDFLTDNIAANY